MAKEWIQELEQVSEENALLMRETVTSSFTLNNVVGGCHKICSWCFSGCSNVMKRARASRPSSSSTTTWVGSASAQRYRAHALHNSKLPSVTLAHPTTQLPSNSLLSACCSPAAEGPNAQKSSHPEMQEVYADAAGGPDDSAGGSDD